MIVATDGRCARTRHAERHKAALVLKRPCSACVCIIYERTKNPIKGGKVGRCGGGSN